MPLYEYRCEQCGPFDQRRQAEDASRPLPCPRCSATANRVYTPLASPSRIATGTQVSAGDRTRVDRARTGEPVITGPPAGRRLRSRGHPH